MTRGGTTGQAQSGVDEADAEDAAGAAVTGAALTAETDSAQSARTTRNDLADDGGRMNASVVADPANTASSTGIGGMLHGARAVKERCVRERFGGGAVLHFLEHSASRGDYACPHVFPGTHHRIHSVLRSAMTGADARRVPGFAPTGAITTE